MEKNEVLKGLAEGYTEEGLAVVKVDGFVFFVPGLIIGEEAEISVTKMKKNYGFARIVNITKPSVHRITPKCGVYRLCGGCQLQHMDEEAQKYYKEDKVRNCFRQNADMNIDLLPILTAENKLNYRNKVQIPVQINNGKVEMGFYQNHTNKVIDYETCYVQSELSNTISAFLKEEFTRHKNAKHIRHVLIKHAHKTNEVMVCLVVRKYPFFHCDELQKNLISAFQEITSYSVIINNNENNVILDGPEKLLYGKPYIEEELLGMRFRISAKSFYQINPYATELLYQTAIDYAKLTGKETVIDLYCGTGTIGILAARKAKKVYGIEIVEDAIINARKNAEINNIRNIDFVCTDASKGAQSIIRSKIKPDVIIVDPPRKGCSKDTIDAMLKIYPNRIVYVSCDPATLARDVKILTDNGYQLQQVQPVDMFPQTVAVENVALLEKKEL